MAHLVPFGAKARAITWAASEDSPAHKADLSDLTFSRCFWMACRTSGSSSFSTMSSAMLSASATALRAAKIDSRSRLGWAFWISSITNSGAVCILRLIMSTMLDPCVSASLTSGLTFFHVRSAELNSDLKNNPIFLKKFSISIYLFVLSVFKKDNLG